jgi:hypothetical protein
VKNVYTIEVFWDTPVVLEEFVDRQRYAADMAGNLCFIVLLIQNSRSCAGKWLYNNRLWFCPREFTTLKGIVASGAMEAQGRDE